MEDEVDPLLHKGDEYHLLDVSASSSALPCYSRGEGEGPSVSQVLGLVAMSHSVDHSEGERPKTLKGKGKVYPLRLAEATKSLQLLDLPVDVLREIVKQVTHTNDLASLALTHSALHALAIPHIYSRFDIVWPDAHSTDDPSSGVDALTFGLATLVMGEESFVGNSARELRGPSPAHPHRCQNCGAPSYAEEQSRQTVIQGPGSRRPWRMGNSYSRFTRKFSLGNGPADMVAEYLITKEMGKMLGTLVALAVARMPILETFIWDMPTGILRDIWLALSSLADRSEGRGCQLKHVWIRWHDNAQAVADGPVSANAISVPALASIPPASPAVTGTGLVPPPPLPPGITTTPHVQSVLRVERPSFSILPPLESLTVLDIDELAYLDEMSVLIERSQDRLRELRVGIAAQAAKREWVKNWDGDDLNQVDLNVTWQNSSSAGSKRLGGVLGVLIGRVHDLKHSKRRKHATTNSKPEQLPDSMSKLNIDAIAASSASSEASESAQLEPGDYMLTQPITYRPHSESTGNGKLKLELLELERVPLCVPALQKAFDWTIMTSLTILNCPHHDLLWKSMRRTFSPIRLDSMSIPTSAQSKSLLSRALRLVDGDSKPAQTGNVVQYPLKLKKIHTDAVSPSLIAFLRETLAPDSLEVLFLLEGRTYPSEVTIGSICRGPLRRHRRSLKKLLIDSRDRALDGRIHPTQGWRKWMFNNEILRFVVSGKMTNLRELGLALDSKDWHLFLQRLPLLPHLRSLYVTRVGDQLEVEPLDPRELALQAVDVVALRPEIELCYIAIAHKCFEIVEGKPPEESRTQSAHGIHQSPTGTGETSTSDNDDSDLDDEDDDDDGEGMMEQPSDNESDMSSESREESEEEVQSQLSDESPHLTVRLREILFYDDKVAIFKARHGRL